MVKVKIKKALPQFVGEDAKTLYGPFDPGDIADVSPVIAEILVFRGFAEYVERRGNE